MKADRNLRLCDVVLDETIGRSTPDVEHERAVAIFDLLEENLFEPVGHPGGPYRLNLSLVDSKLVFAISTDGGAEVATHILSLTPFRRIVKDYFMICESYYEAIRTATPSQIEAIDMGRRSLHDDGAALLRERLARRVLDLEKRVLIDPASGDEETLAASELDLLKVFAENPNRPLNATNPANLDSVAFTLDAAAGTLPEKEALAATLEAERRAFEEKLKLLGEAKTALSDAFNALSANALRSNSEEFFRLAQASVAPIKEALGKFDSKIQALELAREGAYQGLLQQVSQLLDTGRQLRSETSSLAQALRSPVVRGQWGEIQLRRVVEMAGMLSYCDFIEQETLRTQTGMLRPDLVVKLPAGKTIVVGRFATGAAGTVPFAAGVAQIPFGRFLLYAIPTIAVWATALVLLGALVGDNVETIDRIVDRFGRVATNFTRIKAGSLLRASGGYLLFNLMDALTEPLVWKELKRAVKSGSLTIETDPCVPSPLNTFGNTSLPPSDVIHCACGWFRPTPVGSLSMIFCSAEKPGSSSSRKLSSALSGSVRCSKCGEASFGFVTVCVGACPTSVVVSTSPVARAILLCQRPNQWPL